MLIWERSGNPLLEQYIERAVRLAIDEGEAESLRQMAALDASPPTTQA